MYFYALLLLSIGSIVMADVVASKAKVRKHHHADKFDQEGMSEREKLRRHYDLALSNKDYARADQLHKELEAFDLKK